MRPTKERLEALRWIAGSSPGLAVSCSVDTLKALLDDYEARGAALRAVALYRLDHDIARIAREALGDDA